jgi:hypothetical protein
MRDVSVLFRAPSWLRVQGVQYKRVLPGTVRTAPPSQRYGLTTRIELISSGLSRGAISKRVARGALVRRYPGVYSFGVEIERRPEDVLARLLRRF